MRKLLAILFFVSGGVLFSADKIDILLNSGHSEGVLCLVKDQKKGLLLSGGKDGNIRFWREETFEPVGKLQVTSGQVRKIAVHPKLPQLALVESDGTRYALNVWDTDKRTKLYSFPLGELPLIFQYSPQGTFLIVSKTDWKSLLFFDSASGRLLPYFSSGFGIVSFLFLSSSENTLVSYTPSTGTFIYWNLKQGTRKQTVPSQPEMRNLTLYNERYAVGTLGDNLILADLVSGEIAASYECRGVERILTNDKTGEIITIQGEGQTHSLQSWKFRLPLNVSEKGTFYPSVEKQIAQDVTDFVYGKGRLFLSGKDLSAVDLKTWESRVLAEANMEKINDILPRGPSLHIATAGSLFRFDSDFFSSPAGQIPPQASYLSVLKTANVLEGPAFFASPSPDLVYLWKRGENKGEVARLDLDNGKVLGKLTSLNQPLSSLFANQENLYTLEKSGSLKILSLKSFTKFFEYSSMGLESFAVLGKYGILAGQDSTEAVKLPLVSINPETGETVSIRHPSVFLFYRIVYDEKKEKIYFLGLRKGDNGKEETVLQSAAASNLENFTVLLSVDSYDFDADLLVDEDASRLYTSLGGIVRFWNGSRWTSFETNGNQPVKLASHGGKLFAVNQDGTLSVWDKGSGKLLGDICLFNDGNWLAYGPSGNYLTSLEDDQVAKRLTLLKDGKPLPPQKLAGYRLYLPEADQSLR